MMRATKGFHGYLCWRKLSNEPLKLRAVQFLGSKRLTDFIDRMGLKHALSNFDPDNTYVCRFSPSYSAPIMA